MNEKPETKQEERVLNLVINELIRQDQQLSSQMRRLDEIANRLDPSDYPKNFPQESKPNPSNTSNSPIGYNAQLESVIIERNRLSSEIESAISYIERTI